MSRGVLSRAVFVFLRLCTVFSLLWLWGLGGGRVSASTLLGSSAGSVS